MMYDDAVQTYVKFLVLRTLQRDCYNVDAVASQERKLTELHAISNIKLEKLLHR